ncbi:hypothetical protein EVAR_82903_1 [Eumeta japonica]|uniref:Uncharacterized protein n=1 Tax=Eumeta variegata TaxID=151549 RepID=A0A4C1YIY6_EUMVA|nr:hypothetical protein EVAR_82903_1 [Eumeta japonica]
MLISSDSTIRSFAPETGTRLETAPYLAMHRIKHKPLRFNLSSGVALNTNCDHVADCDFNAGFPDASDPGRAVDFRLSLALKAKLGIYNIPPTSDTLNRKISKIREAIFFHRTHPHRRQVPNVFPGARFFLGRRPEPSRKTVRESALISRATQTRNQAPKLIRAGLGDVDAYERRECDRGVVKRVALEPDSAGSIPTMNKSSNEFYNFEINAEKLYIYTFGNLATTRSVLRRARRFQMLSSQRHSGSPTTLK